MRLGQKNLDWKEIWTEKNLMKFCKGKCRSSTWGGKVLGTSTGWRWHVRNSSEEKNQGLFWWTAGCPWASSALGDKEINSILGCIVKVKSAGQERWFCLWITSGQLCPGLGSLAQQRQGVVRVGLTESYKMVKDVQHLSARKGWGTSRSDGWEGIFCVCKWGCLKYGARLQEKRQWE